MNITAIRFSAVLLLMQTGLHGADAPPPRSGEDRTYSAEEAMEIGWPQLAGPLGTFEALPTRIRLVDDLPRAKVLWQSEFDGFGRGKGGSKGFRSAAAFAGTIGASGHPGNWAGPIVGGGMVFCASFRPIGEPATIDGTPLRIDAEDIIVALDAWTGKTRWVAAEPGGMLRGGGKREGFQVAPAYANGTVFSLGSTAMVYAHDAKTGRKLWQCDAHPKRAAASKQRERILAALRDGKLDYDADPAWHSSLVVAAGMVIVPDFAGGMFAIEQATGKLAWSVPGGRTAYDIPQSPCSIWATPAIWRHAGKDHLLVANAAGDLRLFDAASGAELWKMSGLGPNWTTLTPGTTHVLVNVLPDAAPAGTVWMKSRSPGQFGAIRLSPTQGEKAWSVPGDHRIPVWMDNGAENRVLYQAGRFIIPHRDPGPRNPLQRTDAAGRKLLMAYMLDEESGRVLASLPMPAADEDEYLGGLMYWHGDRLISRGDSVHGPSHGGRHPWKHWRVGADGIAELPGKMDLSEFTTGYEVYMEVPLVAGLMFERTWAGTIVCYDLREP